MTYGMHREGIQGSAVGMCEWISKCGIHRSQHVNFINHWGRWEYFVLQQPFRFARWTQFLPQKSTSQLPNSIQSTYLLFELELKDFDVNSPLKKQHRN